MAAAKKYRVQPALSGQEDYSFGADGVPKEWVFLGRPAEFGPTKRVLFDVSGEHVYRSVSEHSPGLLPRFVFMTGGAFTERAQEFLAHFPGRQLEKPFNIDEVEVLLAELPAAGAA